MTIKSEMEQILQTTFQPREIELQDQSDRHIGHAGHDGRGESHFHLIMSSGMFAGKTRVQRHQMVNNALKDYLSGRVHALSMELKD